MFRRHSTGAEAHFGVFRSTESCEMDDFGQAVTARRESADALRPPKPPPLRVTCRSHETSAAVEDRCKSLFFARILRRVAQLLAGPGFGRLSRTQAAASFMGGEYQNTSARKTRLMRAGELWRGFVSA